MTDKEKMEPHFVARKEGEMIVGKEYGAWIAEIKRRYASYQAKAVVKINVEMLRFYWELGADIIRMQKEQGWGNSIIKQLSLDLRDEYPAVNGFSVRNLECMKRWYGFYYEQVIKSQQPVAIFEDAKSYQLGAISKDEISHQLGAILQMPDKFTLIPWRQHVEISYKCKSLDEALFYIDKVIEGNWSRSLLEDYIKSDLYNRVGKAITNYDKYLPESQSELAKSMLKAPYQFDFLDLRPKYTERELEDALVHNITRFLLELGQGFSFVGRQMELRMDSETSFFPDLVFYHYRQKRFVVVELKTGEFIPEYAGKINFYVNAADNLLKGTDDNPSVGLLICRSAKKSVVEWSFQGVTTPIGVATYELEQVVNRTFEEFEKRMKSIEE